MEKLKGFFWLCSGAHTELLKKSPSEASKYAGIGATIFFTGIFAAIAASYALYTVFDSIWLATFFGLIWGLMIFNLDRFIVSSMRKDGNKKREWLTALPRLILALLISIIIAKPLEMKIFNKEIQGELVIMEQETRTAQESEVKERYRVDQETLKADIDKLKREIVDKTADRDRMAKIAQEEADGTGGTMRRNAGPIYKIKKADADRVDMELKELIAKNYALISEKLSSSRRYDSLQATTINNIVNEKLDGPAARMEALSRLTDKSWAIFWANFFIILLFIAIETAPIFVKLISPIGPYDHLLKTEEYSFETQRVENIAKTNAETKSRNEGLPNTEKQFIDRKLDLNLTD